MVYNLHPLDSPALHTLVFLEHPNLQAANKFYWPSMSSTLKMEVKSCQPCMAKQTQVKKREALHKPKKYGFPGEVLYVDLVGPLPRSDKGNAYICTLQDGFTKFVTAVPIPN